jgi:hypothetical protein
LPERPDFSCPRFISCIDRLTFFRAVVPYLRVDFLRPADFFRRVLEVFFRALGLFLRAVEVLLRGVEVLLRAVEVFLRVLDFFRGIVRPFLTLHVPGWATRTPSDVFMSVLSPEGLFRKHVPRLLNS